MLSLRTRARARCCRRGCGRGGGRGRAGGRLHGRGHHTAAGVVASVNATTWTTLGDVVANEAAWGRREGPLPRTEPREGRGGRLPQRGKAARTVTGNVASDKAVITLDSHVTGHPLLATHVHCTHKLRQTQTHQIILDKQVTVCPPLAWQPRAPQFATVNLFYCLSQRKYGQLLIACGLPFHFPAQLHPPSPSWTRTTCLRRSAARSSTTSSLT